MTYDHVAQDAMNSDHRLNPRVGDYWHEMLCGVMVVVGTSDNEVVFCRAKKTFRYEDKWTWDLSKLERVSREDFAEIPLYGSPHMGDKCHCDVVPEAHKWVREKAASELLLNDTNEA